MKFEIELPINAELEFSIDDLDNQELGEGFKLELEKKEFNLDGVQIFEFVVSNVTEEVIGTVVPIVARFLYKKFQSTLIKIKNNNKITEPSSEKDIEEVLK